MYDNLREPNAWHFAGTRSGRFGIVGMGNFFIDDGPRILFGCSHQGPCESLVELSSRIKPDAEAVLAQMLLTRA